jgi:hypothetical protein
MVAKWCNFLQEFRPDVLEKLAHAMAEARGANLTPEAHGLRRRNARRRKLKSQADWIEFRNSKASRASKSVGGAGSALIAERIWT